MGNGLPLAKAPHARCRPHAAPPPPEYRKPLRMKAWQPGTDYRAKLLEKPGFACQPCGFPCCRTTAIGKGKQGVGAVQ